MTIDKKYLITRQGKEFVLYEGLLHEAHGRGLKRITTVLVQAPTAANDQTAIVHATVEMKGGDGDTFDGIGDANTGNVNRMVASHIIRMAETRAKARALRDALDIGATALEEIADSDVEGASASENTSDSKSNRSTPREAIDKDRAATLATMGKAVARLAEVRGTDPKAVLKAACQELGISASNTAQITTPQAKQIAAWATSQAKILQNGAPAGRQSADEPALTF